MVDYYRRQFPTKALDFTDVCLSLRFPLLQEIGEYIQRQFFASPYAASKNTGHVRLFCVDLTDLVGQECSPDAQRLIHYVESQQEITFILYACGDDTDRLVQRIGALIPLTVFQIDAPTKDQILRKICIQLERHGLPSGEYCEHISKLIAAQPGDSAALGMRAAAQLADAIVKAAREQEGDVRPAHIVEKAYRDFEGLWRVLIDTRRSIGF